MEFKLYCPTKIHFGGSSLKQLIEAVEVQRYKHIALIYDYNLSNHELLLELLSGLESRTKILAKELKLAQEPTYSFLESYRAFFMGSGIQAVIGVGGGSTLDTAKAVAVLVNNQNSAISYRGFDKMTEPVLPVYAVPTTAGTGSEITPNASFVDDEADKKLGINGEAIRPRAAYLHPGFIMTCPNKPATYAAIDALVHAIEAYVAQKATLPAKMVAQNAIALLIDNMVPAIKFKDPVAVEKIFLGSLLAALSMMHSGTGPTAALSYPLGVHCKVPHGLAGAVFLCHVIRWNISKGYEGYVGLGQSAGGVKTYTTLIDALSDIWNELNVPAKAGDVGFKKEYMELFLSDLRELRGAVDQNPVDMKEDDLRDLLLASI